MLICMKPTADQVQELKERLVAQRSAVGMSLAEVGHQAGVHPSQVGRIFQGNFRTFSHNVMRVCRTLNVSIDDGAGAPPDANRRRVEMSVERILDGTPENALKVSRLLESVADLGTH